MTMAELQTIERLISKASLRIRLQFIMDGVALGGAAGLFAATAVVAANKAHLLSDAQFVPALWWCGLGPLLALVWAFSRRINRVAVAAAIDASNGFSDRLASAYEFVQSDDVTPFMRAQIDDTMRRLGELDPGKAHPLRRPKDLGAVGVFAVSLLVVLWVHFPEPRVLTERVPQPRPPVIAEEELIRTNLDPGLATFRKDQVEELIKKAEKAENEEAREVAEELRDLLDADQKGEMTPEQFNEKLEAVASKLKSNCKEVDLAGLLGALAPLSPKFKDDSFVDPMVAKIKDGKFGEAAEALDELSEKVVDEKAYTEGIETADFYAKVDATREKYLVCYAEELEKVTESLGTAAEELAKDELTKDVADALKKGDMEAAAKALEDIAKKIESGELQPKDVEKLAKLLEKFADKLDLDDPKIKKAMEQHKSLLSKLQKKMKQNGKLTPKENKQLNDSKKALEKLTRDQEKKDRDESGRRIKRLVRQSRDAADELRKSQQSQLDKNKENKDGEGEKKDSEKNDGEKKDGEGEEPEVSNAADELRKLDKDQKGEETKEQLDEAGKRLKEDAQRSQGEKKKKSIGDDKRANKIDEYLRRAKGEEPQGEEGAKKGEGGQKGDKKGGQEGEKKDGTEKGGNEAGKGHEEGDGPRTSDLDSAREDTKVKGQKGTGPSRAETIKKASQKGFANRNYKEVYDDYEKAVEDVLEQEKVPPGYRHYVRLYFDSIRPQE
ncbi:MAG: hypothetical protein COW42_04050 [Deltaproteobacteria bacterium CG17_big_fil_post_rev_8_21_14_2_50_63_7]|nr:MAG: hypothetical protein COW42_04050 [Deltaproteobacteria bacterium CG17_big_fil_post_rev_8_21_14_2_50_63_7]